MAVSHATRPVTPELVHSSFAQVLHANGPDVARATELELYAWIVGQWELDVTTILDDGTTHRGGGEMAEGSDIVQTGLDPRGGSMRWVFSEIQRDSFHWTAERAPDDRNWRREVDIRARRG